MTKWHGRCHRCAQETTTHTMSKFNQDLICLNCDDEERRHPDYLEAVEREREAVLAGNLDFPGIGWPRTKSDPPFRL